MYRLAVIGSLLMLMEGFGSVQQSAAQIPEPFVIQVVDEETGRGVPLVELETVNHVRFLTDSNGLAAIIDPDLMNERIFFHVRSHGYEYPKNGFGYAGRALDVVPGQRAVIEIKRINIAERLYRITGTGIYRDSVLAGEPVPLEKPLSSGKVAGQDSAFAVPYRGKIYWFWGDTAKLSYPLGHFWMAGAVSDFPEEGGLDPSVGVDLRYFVGEDGFSRPMARLGVESGMIWADTFTVVVDESGQERLVGRYAHMESLQNMLSHGLILYNDDKKEFERLKELELDERWRFPAQAHPIRIQHEDGDFLYFGDVFPTVRVPAKLESFTNLDSYEYFTCLAEGSTADAPRVERDAEGRLLYRWVKHTPPMSVALEQNLLEKGLIEDGERHFIPRDVESGELLRMHRGSVNWNDYRNCYIMIAGQVYGTSLLGEIWYSEAPKPTGPWKSARKIVTHENYDFYNPVHRAFFDQEDGRKIFFEGTYTKMFSDNKRPTPRYEYNQIMYRLDLADERLHLFTDR